jgi:hypothetical protein
MSIAWDRLIRMMNYDRYLPLKCFAPPKYVSNLKSYCDCFFECKFTTESRENQDSQNSKLVKVLQSQ